jgi:hypothetical protein
MLRTLTFGDLKSGIWGALWDAGDGGPRFALVGDGADVSGAVLTDDWGVMGEAISLQSTASGEPTELPDGFDQLATVSGRLTIAGAEVSVQSLGRRGLRGTLDPAAYESVRDVSAWFTADDGVALTSARPAGARGHADDVVSVSAFESGHPLAISEPRLSTTYASDGSPIRAGLELWLQDQREGEQAEEEQEHVVLHPRRAAGEATGSIAVTESDSLAVEARLFRWHSRGLEGAGVYVLARSR